MNIKFPALILPFLLLLFCHNKIHIDFPFGIFLLMCEDYFLSIYDFNSKLAIIK